MSTVVSKTTLSLYVDVMNIHKYLATKTIPKFMIVNVQLYVWTLFLFIWMLTWILNIIKLQSYEKKIFKKSNLPTLFLFVYCWWTIFPFRRQRVYVWYTQMWAGTSNCCICPTQYSRWFGYLCTSLYIKTSFFDLPSPI